MEIKIVTTGGTLPEYKTPGAAGMDLVAFLKEPVIIKSGERALIPTGIAIELPIGYEAQIRPRSGNAIKYAIGIVNGVGTIDSDYRGEIKVILINWGHEDFLVSDGDRIAQIVISRYEKISWEKVDELTVTARGEGGFGHTGK